MKWTSLSGERHTNGTLLSPLDFSQKMGMNRSRCAFHPIDWAL